MAGCRLGWKRGDQKALDLLKSDDPSVRHWGIISLRNAKFSDEKLHDQIRDFMDDISAPVRIEAASWLAMASESHRQEALTVLVSALNLKDWSSALRACRAIEFLGEKAKPVLPVMRKLYDSTRHEKGDENFFIAFSSGAFLEKLGEATEAWDFTPDAGSFSADPPAKEK